MIENQMPVIFHNFIDNANPSVELVEISVIAGLALVMVNEKSLRNNIIFLQSTL